jgi:uncharacterized protein (TIGR03437 family)
VMQVNLRVPIDVPTSSSVSLFIFVGANSTRAGVTLAVK